MKKFRYFFIVLISFLVLLILTGLFLLVYVESGFNANKYYQDTLFYLLSATDWSDFIYILGLTAAYMLMLDILLCTARRSWNKALGKARLNSEYSWLYRYWKNNQNIHITFILFTIFLTISITAPSSLMNTFTAIVSISLLVSNLTKKIGK